MAIDTFKSQLESFLQSRGLYLPEWYIRKLELSTPSDRIKLLKSRGINELPIVSETIPVIPISPVPPVIPSYEISGDAFYGMKIESIQDSSNEITVTTTGATYILTNSGLEMWRNISTSTNSYNPRLVGKLTFNINYIS